MESIASFFLILCVFGVAANAIALQIRGKLFSVSPATAVLGLGIMLTAVSFSTFITSKAIEYTGPVGAFLMAVAIFYKAYAVYKAK